LDSRLVCNFPNKTSSPQITEISVSPPPRWRSLMCISRSPRYASIFFVTPPRPSGAGAALSSIMASDPVFFELSWSVLSIIGAANVFFGLLVISVTNFSPIATVPLITSTACAVANGLCYYAFYLTYPPAVNQAVASTFADMLWLVSRHPPARLVQYLWLTVPRGQD